MPILAPACLPLVPDAGDTVRDCDLPTTKLAIIHAYSGVHMMDKVVELETGTLQLMVFCCVVAALAVPVLSLLGMIQEATVP